jgi:hypothetical protein
MKLPCAEERGKVEEIRSRPHTQEEIDIALLMLSMCIMRARLEFDQMIWEREMARLKEEWELFRLPDEVKPWPLPCDMRSKEVRGQIFDDRQKAMIFSERLAEAFRETGIELEDNETFACLVCVVPRSRYVSEVIGPAFLEAGPTSSALTYIAGPEEMSITFEALLPESPG